LNVNRINNLGAVNPWHRPCFIPSPTHLADYPEESFKNQGEETRTC
jgi:hypothetical protein